MGVDNKARRAAKQRRRRQGRGSTGPARQAPVSTDGGGTDDGAGSPGWGDAGWTEPGWPTPGRPTPGSTAPPDWTEVAEREVAATVVRVGGRLLGALEAQREVQRLLVAVGHAPLGVVAEAGARQLRGVVREVVRGGWDRADLDELARRRVGERDVATLHAGRAGARPEEQLVSQVRLLAVLVMLPLARPGATPCGPTAARSSGGAGEKHLARVRALLAKAESTGYDAEAEALSAKAQELISRYALERLLQQDAAGSSAAAPLTRRVWLDAPYVMAKAALVDAVASANRCRCVVSERIGLCTVVGGGPDLDAVELLVTSLLVQATRSMLRHGQQRDLAGGTRTRSFRRSFLLSFATRIGERLREVEQDTIRRTQPGTSLVPVLAAHERRVAGAVEAMFPTARSRASRVTDQQGWAAGHVAADLAHLDVHPQLGETGG